MDNNGSKPDPGVAARRLIRGRDHGALATLLEGRPYVSLVAIACDHDAAPLLLLSDLAQHTKNLLADRRVSLLFEATAGHPDPLRAGPTEVFARTAVEMDRTDEGLVDDRPSANARGGT